MDRCGTAKLRELAGKCEEVPPYDAKPDLRDFGCIRTSRSRAGVG